MPLNIAHHKSYHPYNRDNIERVRRDEEEVRRKQEAREQQRQAADSEARLELLRTAKGKGTSVENVSETLPVESSIGSGRVGNTPPPSGESSKNGSRSAGHINFWADLEGRNPPGSDSRGRKRPSDGVPESDAAAGDAAERAKLEMQMTVYLNGLEKEGKPWYSDPQLRGPKERRKTQDETLEAAYKDSALKSNYDPLKAMSGFLAQREQAVRQRRLEDERRIAAELGQQRQGDRDTADLSSAGPSSYRHYVSEAWGSTAPEESEAEREVRLRQMLRQRRDEQDFQERPDGADLGESDRALPRAEAEDLMTHTTIGSGGLTATRPDVKAEETAPAVNGAMDTIEHSIQQTAGKAASETGAANIVQEATGLPTAEMTGLQMQDQLPKQPGESPPMHVGIKVEPVDTAATSTEQSVAEDAVDSARSPAVARESMYPVLLGEMIATVLSTEEYLFSEDEVRVLRCYPTLSYEARYLFSRLIQRKDSWLRFEALRSSYQSEVTDMESAVEALTGASQPRFLITHAEAGDDGQEAMLSLLTLDELKTLAKRCNTAKPGTTKASHIAALLKTRTQGTLSSAFFPVSPSKRKAAAAAAQPSPAKPSASAGAKQLALNFTSNGKKASQSVKLAAEVTKLLGVLVKVHSSTRSLIDRVALVFYRGAMLGATALTTAVLSRSRRRNYPRYETQRSPRVFPSREHLLAFEEAVAVEAKMEELLQWGDGTEATFAKALAYFETIWPIWKATVTAFDQEHPDGPDRMAYHRMRFHAGWPQTRVVYKGTVILARFKLHKREEEVLRALLGQRHFRRGKRGEWYDRLALVTAMYSYPDNKNKGKSEALKIAVQGIEDPDTHLIYHDQLQKRICRLENQLPIPKSQKHDFSYAKLKQCSEKTYYGVRLDSMDDGLQSRQRLLAPLNNIVAPKSDSPGESPEGSRFVQRAPMRKIVKVERQTSPTKLGSALMKRSTSSSSDLSLDAAMRNDETRRKMASPSPFDAEGADEATLVQYEVSRKESRTSMASVWRGLDGQPCRVENVVLQHYELEGYKGFHDEGGILKMLFALCLWDVIFHAPGVTDIFETPYQRAPLDMGQDSFCITRGPFLRERLSLVAQGGAEALIREVDDRERPTATWALGCRWDAFTQEDLVEVANCIPGQSLSVIFQMMAEEWEHCSGGMPDLLVYRLSDKSVKLCEVKSVNDRLSETQKVWIDVLLRAGVQVELSLVREVEGSGRERERGGSRSPVKRQSGGETSPLKKEFTPGVRVKDEPEI